MNGGSRRWQISVFLSNFHFLFANRGNWGSFGICLLDLITVPCLWSELTFSLFFFHPFINSLQAINGWTDRWKKNLNENEAHELLIRNSLTGSSWSDQRLLIFYYKWLQENNILCEMKSKISLWIKLMKRKRKVWSTDLWIHREYLFNHL
jgi:hypothetical protein